MSTKKEMSRGIKQVMVKPFERGSVPKLPASYPHST